MGFRAEPKDPTGLAGGWGGVHFTYTFLIILHGRWCCRLQLPCANQVQRPLGYRVKVFLNHRERAQSSRAIEPPYRNGF